MKSEVNSFFCKDLVDDSVDFAVSFRAGASKLSAVGFRVHDGLEKHSAKFFSTSFFCVAGFFNSRVRKAICVLVA